ncbi:MAG TPA: cell envelope integrity protein CreD [Burkholderiales bacterium]
MKTALAKIAVIVVLAVALFVPVAMIQSLVAERQQRRDEAVNGIAEGWGKRQTLAGPYVALPYARSWTQVTQEVADGKARERRTERTESQIVHVPPENVTWVASAEIGEKARGIYKARLYNAKLEAQGTIRIPPGASLEDGKSRYKWGTPRLVIGIGDPHGIRAAESVAVGNRRYNFVPGTGEAAFPGGLHAPLSDAHVGASQTLSFSFSLELGGSESFAISPLGADTSVSMRAGWPHPSFQGRFLPARHEIGPDGFTAEWKVSRFAGQSPSQSDCPWPCGVAAESIAVSFIEPAGLYQQLERTSKYGFLFIGLTFAAFMLLELLRRLALHPVQYTLVGLALAIFFLLLVALSEHIAFAAAYAIAAAACVGLVSAYLVRALRSARLGLGFGAALGALYAVLYVLLQAEDYSLLGGSLLVFGLLAAVMLGTWRVDWYQLIRGQSPNSLLRT